jgi:hypothetical protein
MTRKLPPVRPSFFVSGALILLLSGCRLGYEVLDVQEGTGLGGAHSGDGDGDVVVGDGDGDGDGDVVGDGDGDGDVVGDGDGDSGGSDGSGGQAEPASGGAASGVGGTDAGGSNAGGTDSGTGGASADGGSSSGGAAAGGDAGTGGAVVGDIIVNSSSGSTEAGKTSLRDAILTAQGSGVHKTITFDASITSIQMAAALPTINVPITIFGGGVALDFGAVGGNPDCLTIQGGTAVIDSIQISGCPAAPIYISGGTNHIVRYSTFFEAGVHVTSGATNVTVGPGNYFEGGNSYVVYINAAGSLVVDNIFVESGLGSASIGVFSVGDLTSVIGNLLIRSGTAILTGPGTDSVKVWHNTVVSAASTGMDFSNGSNLDVRNNIVSHTIGTGLIGGASFAQFGYNLFFSNGTNCISCPSGNLGTNPQTGDPLYLNFAGDDFEIGAGSAAQNNGDPSVPAGRSSNGLPDIGYFESAF